MLNTRLLGSSFGPRLQHGFTVDQGLTERLDRGWVWLQPHSTMLGFQQPLGDRVQRPRIALLKEFLHAWIELWPGGSSSCMTSLAASSKSAIRWGKASRKKPLMRTTTSTRGRPSCSSGTTSMPATRRLSFCQQGSLYHCQQKPIGNEPLALS